MKIIADSNLVLLDETFALHGQIQRIDGRHIKPEQLHGANVLLVRSVSHVGQSLLAGSSVRFVGSATIGTDHLDTAWMDGNGVTWAAAPGCNADAASQYTLAMILLACERLGRDIEKQSVGIIGHGNVGSRVHHLLKALGVSSVSCDPPLADQGMPGLVSMDEVLAQDIISLHVPLTLDGPHPTCQLLNAGSLEKTQPGALLVNTSRGDVTDGAALLEAVESGRIHAALDVWPNEPAIDSNLLNAALVATPHVAGYSVEGKQNGTLQVYDAYCRWLGADPATVMTEPAQSAWDCRDKPDQLARLITTACNVQMDDADIRRLQDLPPFELAAGFDQLRKQYRLRHDVDTQV